MCKANKTRKEIGELDFEKERGKGKETRCQVSTSLSAHGASKSKGEHST